MGQFSKIFEADCSVYEVAKNEAGRVRLAAKKERRRFIQERLGEVRIALDAFDNSFLEITS